MCGALTFFSAAVCFFAGVFFGLLIAALMMASRGNDKEGQD